MNHPDEAYCSLCGTPLEFKLASGVYEGICSFVDCRAVWRFRELSTGMWAVHQQLRRDIDLNVLSNQIE